MSETLEVVEKRNYLRLEQQEAEGKSMLGFWIYIMTDCVLFASLFATFAVLRNNTFGGPSGHNLFSAPYVLAETLVLLTSSFTCGLGILAARQKSVKLTQLWFAATFLLGVIFLLLEMNEFVHFAHSGNSWQRSGFLSAFFTLVGTHGLHITSGLIWMLTLRARIWKRGLNRKNLRQLTMLSYFWHFLDIVWIFIFTIVYMMGLS